MKERYVKPQLLFESFSLSQTIAKDCGDTHDSTLGESTHYEVTTCMWDVGGYTIFFDHCGDEQIDMPEEGEYDDIYEYVAEVLEVECYNNPDGGQMVFSSM